MTASAKSPGLKNHFVPISKFTNNSKNTSKGLYVSLISKASPGYLCPLSAAETPKAPVTLPMQWEHSEPLISRGDLFPEEKLQHGYAS